jgi:molybdopterin molybdotransferase
MPEFLTLLPPTEALQQLLLTLPVVPSLPELIDTKCSLGRVVAEPVIAPHPLPAFPRSTVDGYAVRAADTYGASDHLPCYLKLAGEIPMGAEANIALTSSYCALIHTGGMLPDGADAVVMLEHTQHTHTDEIEILRSVAVGENILQVGEDVATGDEVIPAGTRIRPAEIGGLMALGLTKVAVVRKPRIGIISSGDEIIPPETPLQAGQVHDINTYTLSALIEDCGGVPVRYGIIPDQAVVLHTVSAQALLECDAVVITAGSSASTRDFTAQVIDAIGRPGVLVHGVNIRPGKPTILAVCNGKAVIGLPGNPVSALVVASLFVIPVVESLLRFRHYVGLNRKNLGLSTRARLAINIPSQAGREDWIPVRLIATPTGIMAEPLFGKSNLIFTLVRADGMIYIPPDITGITAGEMVEVISLY